MLQGKTDSFGVCADSYGIVLEQDHKFTDTTLDECKQKCDALMCPFFDYSDAKKYCRFDGGDKYAASDVQRIVAGWIHDFACYKRGGAVVPGKLRSCEDHNTLEHTSNCCGNFKCEGPENAQNCPSDCQVVEVKPEEVELKPEEVEVKPEELEAKPEEEPTQQPTKTPTAYKPQPTNPAENIIQANVCVGSKKTHKIFSICGSPCVKTCLNPNPICTQACEAKCVCPPALPIWNAAANECQALSACGGTTVNTDICDNTLDQDNPIVQALLHLPKEDHHNGVAKHICMNRLWRAAHTTTYHDMCGDGKKHPLDWKGPKGKGANDYCKSCECGGNNTTATSDMTCEGDDRVCGMPFKGMTDTMPANTHICEFTQCEYKGYNGGANSLQVKHTKAIAGLDFKCAHNLVTGKCTCLCHGTRESSAVGPMLAGEHKLSRFEGEQCQKIPFRFPDYTDAKFDLSKGQVHVVASLQDHDNLGHGEMDHVPAVTWVESVRDTYFILCMKQDGQFESVLPFSLRSLPKVNYLAWQGENMRDIDYSPFPHSTSGATTINIDLSAARFEQQCQNIEFSAFGKAMFQNAQGLDTTLLDAPAILGSLQYSRRYSSNLNIDALGPLSSWIGNVTNDGFVVCVSTIAGRGTLSAAESTSPDFGDEATAPEQPEAAVTFSWTALAPQSDNGRRNLRMYAAAGQMKADPAKWETNRLVEGGHEYMHMQCQTVELHSLNSDEDNRNFVHPLVIITPVEDCDYHKTKSHADHLRMHNVTDVWVEDVSLRTFSICASEISRHPEPPAEQSWNWVVFNSNGRWRDTNGPWNMQPTKLPTASPTTCKGVDDPSWLAATTDNGRWLGYGGDCAWTQGFDGRCSRTNGNNGVTGYQACAVTCSNCEDIGDHEVNADLLD
jgi:hypothetical protein